NDYSRPPNNQPHNVAPVDDETHKRMVENFLRDTRQSQPSRHRQAARTSKRNRSRTPSPERKRKRSSPVIASQWDVERRSLSPLRDGDIWQAYRHMVDHSVRELNTSFEVYKSDPEEHPLYKDEWQKFWKRRKDELIASGINHRTYNYQGEWILFFNARLEELYNQDLENIKIKCRERLCLPMTNNELTDTKYHVNVADYLHEPEIEPLQEPAHIENTVEHRREPIEHRREPSPPKPKPKPREAREEVNVIHVLRLLTALEDYLGSLGPNITELLAKALQISKVHPDKVNSLILSPENCVVLETAKEKFTGLIISKMLEGNQERALKKAVNDTEALLEFAAELTAQGSNENEKTTENSSTAGPSLSNSYSNQEVAQKTKSTGSYKISDQFDKSELAAKLASSLISQGKTKINPEQLKQIIQVYSLIEQKKHQEPSSSTTNAGINSSSITFSSNTSERQQLLNLNPSEQNREQAYYFNSATQNRGSYNPNADTQNRDSFNSNPVAQNRESYNSSSAVPTRNQFNASSAQQNPKSKLPAQNQPFYNSNSNHDRQTFTNQNQFMNSNMTSDMQNMQTSSNYFSANMAQTNNTIFNKNTYGGNAMEYNNSDLPDQQYNQFNDSGQFNNNRNPSSMYANRTYPFGSSNNNTGDRRNWM
ncbi:dr1-associated corepressor homolog, partial [Drosophila albomicans]|uniref:Dr1-associated corepressor homolog n=1 Tax=Drosophila albomicans TaxID=7291 RepID=A0A6P8XGR6_DROAB